MPLGQIIVSSEHVFVFLFLFLLSLLVDEHGFFKQRNTWAWKLGFIFPVESLWSSRIS